MKSSIFLEQQSWSLVCLTHKKECFGPMPCKSLPLVTQCHVIGSSNCEAIWKWSLIMMFQEKTERRTNFGKWGYLWIAYSKVAAFMLDHNVSPSMSRWSHLQEPGNCEMEWNCAGLWGAPRFKGSRFSGAGFRGILFFFFYQQWSSKISLKPWLLEQKCFVIVSSPPHKLSITC